MEQPYRLIFGICLICLQLSGLPVSGQSVWDLNVDATAQQLIDPASPSFSPWSYGFGPEDSRVNIFGFTTAVYVFNAAGSTAELFGEPADPGPSLGLIGYNDWIDDLGVGVSPGLHLMAIGSSIHPAKIRWTAPVTSEIDINGVFTAGNWADVLVSIVKNDSEILYSNTGSTDMGFTLNQNVNIGDTIDFILREAGDFNGSHTGVDVTIAAVTPLVFPDPNDEPTIGSNIVSLDGNGWFLATDSDDIGIANQWYNAQIAGAKPTKVPWIIHDAFPGYQGVSWYWHDFIAPANPHLNGRYLMRFWSVGYKATVWVNGTEVGQHEGADTPFVLDITDVINSGLSNLVAIRIIDPTQSGTDGIIRSQIPGGNVFPHAGIEDSVELIASPGVWLKDVFFEPDPSTGTISIDATVQNDLGYPATIFAKFMVTPQDDIAWIYQVVPSGETHIQAQLQVNSPHLWDIDDPYLYQMTTKIWEENTDSFDDKSVKSGFRNFRVENGYFRLNDKRIFLRCAHTGNADPMGIRVAYDPNWMLYDITAMKAMGFNAIRFFQSLATRQQLDLCDEIGLMVYEESRGGWQMDWSSSYQQRRNSSITEMIKRDRNHPSVVAWGLLNESPWLISSESPIFDHAEGALSLIRSLDDTRLVFLSSGRWDCKMGTGSVSNPGSSFWQPLLGNEAPGAAKITPYCDINGGGPPLSPKLPIAGYVGPTECSSLGDVHIYPRNPHTAEIIDFIRTLGECSASNLFVSEYGIASAVNLTRLWDLYGQYGFQHLEHAIQFNNRRLAFMNDWYQWGMGELFGDPNNYFQEAIASNAGQRLLGINALRSNPDIAGYSLTATVDTWASGEGLITLFREQKPGMQEAVSDGSAPLRWCLFTEPLNLYRGNSVKLDVVLANEDVLSQGPYSVHVEVFGPGDVRVVDRYVNLNISNTPEPPLALDVYSENIVADWPSGQYRLTASFNGGPVIAGQDAVFYVADPVDMPSVGADIVLWGIDTGLSTWLTSQGITWHQFNPNSNQREVILVTGTPPAPGGQAVFDELVSHIEAGSVAIFLSPEVFANGNDPTYYVPLTNKGVDADNFAWTGLIYGKDVWAKNHPIFEGMPTGGILDYTYYRELFSDIIWENQTPPTETVAAAMVNSLGYYSTLRISVHDLGLGRFIQNLFRVRENLGTHPAAERLLRNLLLYAANNIYLDGDATQDHYVDFRDYSVVAGDWNQLPAGSNEVWDLNNDVLLIQPTGNPTSSTFGQWSYGFGPQAAFIDPLGFNLAQYFGNIGGTITELFTDPFNSGDALGFIFYNDSGVSQAGVSPDLHGLVIGASIHPAKIRWTAPYAMDVEIDGVFTAGNWAEVLVSIIKNNSAFLFTQISTVDIPFQVETSVATGDTIEFVLRESNNYAGSHTGLEATIARSAQYLSGDLNKDFSVDKNDLTVLSEDWLQCN